MILAIDAGNSRVKWGWLETAKDGRGWLETAKDGRGLLETARDGAGRPAPELDPTGAFRWSSIATVSLIEFAASSDHLNPFSVTHEAPESVVISNVAGEGAHQLLVNWTGIFDAEPLWLRGEAERCGVRNRYERPEQLGPDRWAALVAARGLHSGACLVVNAGTATTVDMLAADGTFLGGAILPGIELMRFVLHEHTGRLPIQQGSFRETPRNTVDAIETGCRHAQAGAIERMYRAFRELDANPLCMISGGAGRPLMDQLSAPRRYVENLVLDGLARIALNELELAEKTPARAAR